MLPKFQSADLRFKFEKLRILPDQILFLSWKFGREAFLLKSRKRLEVIDVVILGCFA